MRLATVAPVVPDHDAAIAFPVRGLGWALLQDIPRCARRWVSAVPPGGGPAPLLARASKPPPAASAAAACFCSSKLVTSPAMSPA
jgi:hypothetical protein